MSTVVRAEPQFQRLPPPGPLGHFFLAFRSGSQNMILIGSDCICGLLFTNMLYLCDGTIMNYYLRFSRHNWPYP
jgi:hypothetical protein